MIRQSLSTRNTQRAYVPFRVITIPLKNRECIDCGIVSYVRLGSCADTLDEVIYESIKQKYPFSDKNVRVCTTSQPFGNFRAYENSTRLFISVKNSTSYDPGYEDDTLDSMLAISLDVYNPTDAFVCNEIELYSRISKEDISRAANEIEHNLETYNTFIQ